MSVKYYIFVIAVIKKDSYRNMKKLIGAFLLVLGLGFVACENETKNGDPSIIAMVNNEEFTTGVKFETWRPQFTDLKVANENVFYLKAETDTTLFSIRVPYTYRSDNENRKFIFGDVKQVENSVSVAFAQFIVFDKKTKTPIAIYKTSSDSEVISNPGEFEYAEFEKRVPGTISGSFYANMKKDTLPGYHKLSQKQKDYYTKTLRDVKSFQDGMIYRMPVSAGK